MTSAEIVHELRAARPAAPYALRARVEAIAASTPAPRPSVVSRFLPRRRGPPGGPPAGHDDGGTGCPGAAPRPRAAGGRQPHDPGRRHRRALGGHAAGTPDDA